MNPRIDDKVLVTILQEGGIAVLPSDTLYGIMTSALREQSVERLYNLRRPDNEKQFIVLLNKSTQVNDFDLSVPLWAQTLLERAWPGPVSFVLSAGPLTPAYLHRGKKTVAVRVPADEDLRALIAKTGPLVAPSANLPGMPPATTAYWAQQYFMDDADCYFDGGYCGGKPSTVVAILDNGLKILREGAYPVDKLRYLAGEESIV